MWKYLIEYRFWVQMGSAKETFMILRYHKNHNLLSFT